MLRANWLQDSAEKRAYYPAAYDGDGFEFIGWAMISSVVEGFTHPSLNRKCHQLQLLGNVAFHVHLRSAQRRLEFSCKASSEASSMPQPRVRGEHTRQAKVDVPCRLQLLLDGATGASRERSGTRLARPGTRDHDCHMPGPLRRPEFGSVVAELEFLLVSPDGMQRVVKARIGQPYSDEDTVWACPCEISGWESRYPDIRGEGSWQSLCLAIALVRSRLEDWQAKGGAILDTETREPVQLRPLFGGIAH